MSQYKLDQSSDFSQRELYQFLKIASVLPDYVEKAASDDEDTLAHLPKEAFADEINKAYPINSPARVYVSHSYFQNKKASLGLKWGKSYTDKVELKLQKAAALFGIQDDLNAYAKEAQASQDKDYGVKYIYTAITKVANFPLFPVRTKNDVIKVANELNFDMYPFEWRAGIAESILKEAEERGVGELPDLVCKYAGVGYFPDVPAIKEEIQRRSCKLKTAESKQTYQVLIDNLTEGVDSEDVMKMAEIVYYTEKLEGLYANPKVAALLPDPVDKFFTISYEKAASTLNLVDIAGESYHIDDLKKISDDKYEQALGFKPDFTNEKSAREELETVPRSDFALLKELTGVQPVG